MNKIKELGKDIYFDEGFINMLGYEWMYRYQRPEALEIFKLNVEAFPKSSNAYDGLGEAYMNKGDTNNAIINYKKSLELNPENNNAVEKLKVLEKQ